MNNELIFAMGQPRSGTTLLQRIIMTSGQVCCPSEPWLLLPGLRMFEKGYRITDYDHSVFLRAFNGLKTPQGEVARLWERAVADFYLDWVSTVSDKPKFLDKTPRYYLIITDLLRIFDNAKFLLTVRNPLAVMASIAETWYKGVARWDRHQIDLITAPGLIANALQLGDPRIHPIRYEDLASQERGPAVVASLESFLGIKVRLDCLSEQRITGRFGDPINRDTKTISAQSVDKWQAFFRTPFRKKKGRDTLRKIGRNNLRQMGYDMGSLERMLSEIPIDWTLSLRESLGMGPSRTVSKRESKVRFKTRQASIHFY